MPGQGAPGAPASLARRSVLAAAAASVLALVTAPAARALPPATATGTGATGSREAGAVPSRGRGRAGARPLRVDPAGGADAITVQEAVDAVRGDGGSIVLAPGTYRETVVVPADRTRLTLSAESGDPAATVIVFDRAAGTPKPGGGTYGTGGSATVTVRADDFTARGITFANDWVRADHPGVAGTQAVALLVQGDRSAFLGCRFLGHQDTLYADTAALGTFARQYFRDCYVEGDVDFVFGRGTAVFDGCHFHTLTRADLSGAPYGFVFAPSTAVANPRGYLVTGSRITSAAPAGYYKLARPWVPSSDPTARPMLTVRNTDIDRGTDTRAPYANMSDAHPWQDQRFAEYRNAGAGAGVPVPANRPQLTDVQAAQHTPGAYLGDWAPPRE